MSRPITLICNDGAKIESDSVTLEKSRFLKDLMDEYKEDSDMELPDVDGPTMTLILEWLDKYKTEEIPKISKPLLSYDFKVEAGEWGNEYMIKVHNNSWDSLFIFLNAVNFLNIPELLELGCAYNATLIKDMTSDEIKDLFQIEEDCTEEDIKKMEEDYLKERQEIREKERLKREEEEKEKEKETTTET